MQAKGFKLGAGSRRRLRGVHPDLVRVVERAIQLTEVDFSVTEGLRSRERQEELVAKGWSKTMNSRHIRAPNGFGHAVDLVPWRDTDGDGTNELDWPWEHFYPIASAMQKAALELGVQIRWGGVWDKYLAELGDPEEEVREYVSRRREAGRPAFIDGPHFELSWKHYLGKRGT